MVTDAAVTKLAENPTFQRFAVKVVDSVQEAQKKLESAAEDPNGAAKTAQHNMATFFSHFKDHVTNDLKSMGPRPWKKE